MSKEKILYLECGTGISGDMTVAALLDLGADEDKLRRVLAGIPGGGFRIAISRVKKSGIDCCDFDVILDEAHDGHDHDMEYLYGHLKNGQDDGHSRDHDHDHHHDHGHDHHHDHDHDHHDHDHDHHHDHDHDHHHDHDHDHHHDHHHHTGMAEIREIIGGLSMTDGARALALRIFGILAEAEAEAHGVTVEEVHFHEVGALDSIVDIVAAAVCLDDLGITRVAVPAVTEGSGTVRCQHGILQVPVPAVTAVAKNYGLPLRFSARKGELVTPTGAAILAAVMTEDRLPETFVILKTGLGAGKREYEIPSILRAMILEERDQQPEAERAGADEKYSHEGAKKDTIWKLECDIDDCTGEQLGYAMDRLYAEGAREAHYTPVFMKKNRPGWELTVICDAEHLSGIEQVIFEETTTIGIRKQEMERSILTRKTVLAKTGFGEIPVKVSGEGRHPRVHPEYDKVAEAALRCGVPFGAVYEEALFAASKK